MPCFFVQQRETDRHTHTHAVNRNGQQQAAEAKPHWDATSSQQVPTTLIIIACSKVRVRVRQVEIMVKVRVSVQDMYISQCNVKWRKYRLCVCHHDK